MSVPPHPPNKPTVSDVLATSVMVSFIDGPPNGGPPVDARQIGYSKTTDGPNWTTPSDGSTVVAGLSPKTTYHFWARTHNSVGWSIWSLRTSVTTTGVPDAPDPVVIFGTGQRHVLATFTGNGNGGSPVTARQIGYGTSPLGPTHFSSMEGISTITGLDPATTYYFWGREANASGWGPFSTVRSTRTLAGARILVGTVWKEAIPYVKLGGVWKVAEPWARRSGLWNRTG